MKLPQRAILAPLLGLGCGWILFMFASWSDLFVQPVYDAAGNFLSDGPSVRLSTYLYLLGIALFAFGAFLGLRLSSKHRAGNPHRWRPGPGGLPVWEPVRNYRPCCRGGLRNREFLERFRGQKY